jgi:hypothetical protein
MGRGYAITMSCYIHQALYSELIWVNFSAGRILRPGNIFAALSTCGGVVYLTKYFLSSVQQYDFTWRSYLI